MKRILGMWCGTALICARMDLVGRDSRGALGDVHALDVRRGLWWQVHATGEYPSVRHAHVALRFAHELLVIGGVPAAVAAADVSVHAFDCRWAELHTDTRLAEVCVAASLHMAFG